MVFGGLVYYNYNSAADVYRVVLVLCGYVQVCKFLVNFRRATHFTVMYATLYRPNSSGRLLIYFYATAFSES